MKNFEENIKTAHIICIGDELLIGQVVNTNATFLAHTLNLYGIFVEKIITVPDDAQAISQAVADSFAHTNIIFTTGGLGPTRDDITKKVLCDYFQTVLVESAEVKQHVQTLYANRPCLLNHLTESQWLVPKDAKIFKNRVGSAPIMLFEKNGKQLFAFPGVPYEMKVAVNEQIIPFLQQQHNNKIIHKTLILHGVGESVLAEKIATWEDALPINIRLAYLPDNGVLRLRLSGYDTSEDTIDERIKTLYPLIKPYYIGEGETKTIEQILGDLLKANHQTIATAESCTGGKLASLLNKWSGSSAFYMGSVIAYDNAVKRDVLGVDETILQSQGAVSEATAKAMALGVRHLLHTDFAIATTGVAGPTGGTPTKPVGTVWISWATPTDVFAKEFHLGSERETITDRACKQAIVQMITLLKN